MHSVSDALRQQNEINWKAATEHDFCKDLANGSLSTALMANYLIQDYSFIDGFVRLAASAIANAENSYLAEGLTEGVAVEEVTGSSITYRIAVGPHKGRPVYRLQSLPACLLYTSPSPRDRG